MPHTYEYPRAALTVDCVVFGFDEAELKVLLIRRGLAPFKGKWALPGGFVRVDETLDEAARRELSEETGLSKVFLEQLYTFGEVKRDPRERVVSVAYYALVKSAEHPAMGASDADTLGDGLLLLIEGAYISGQLFGLGGPAQSVARNADLLIEASLKK